MKKIMLMVLSVALCASCAAKKPVQQPVQQSVQQVDPQQAKLDSLRRAQEIRRIELQMQAEEADMQAQLEIAKLKADNAKRATSKRVAQDLYTPCIDESYDKPGDTRECQQSIISSAGRAPQEAYSLALQLLLSCIKICLRQRELTRAWHLNPLFLRQ